MENEQTNETKQKEFQVIIKPSLARKLLKLGHQIKDIKPNKDNPKVATVFVFENSEKFRQDMVKLTKDKY